ncbi:MAG: hypothetical protein JOY54_11315 [Acidobacteriaceae bacterium]|nr:hypothetical protein [Acidobacteriaceae bacterium]
MPPLLSTLLSTLRRELKALRRASPPLTFTGLLMLAAFLFSLVGIFLDPRVITGVTVWLKPAKFGISTAIFALSIAWIFRYIDKTAWKPVLEWTLSAMLILEVGVIDIQAARGTTSHFNVGTSIDSTLYLVMGVAIGIIWLTMVAVFLLLLRQKFRDRVWGWALRLGMLLTIFGAGSGGWMLRPTQEQAVALARHQPGTTIGGHTVGAPDGGPGLPGVGWSTRHGDLRIPHFLGLHGLQVIPLLTWFLLANRPSSEARRIGMVFAAAASYAALYAILTWQALRGQSILQPDARTITALAVWLVVSLAAVALLDGGAHRPSRMPHASTYV